MADPDKRARLVEALKSFRTILAHVERATKRKGPLPWQCGYDEPSVIEAWQQVQDAMQGQGAKVRNLAHGVWEDVLTLTELSDLPVVLQSLDALMEVLEAKKPQDDSTDGPVAPDGFRFQGVVYHGLGDKPFRALDYVWTQDNRTAYNSDLAEPVYGDREEDLIPDNAVGGWRREINRFFIRNIILYHAKQGGRSRKFLAVCDGPPAESQPKKQKSKDLFKNNLAVSFSWTDGVVPFG